MRSLAPLYGILVLLCGCGRALVDLDELDDLGDDSESEADESDEASENDEAAENGGSSTTAPSTTIDGGPDWGDDWGEEVGGQDQREAHGLTWLVRATDHELGLALAGSDEFANPYVGDTPCTTQLPIVCIAKLGLPNPGIETDYYHGWTGGRMAITSPIVGTELTSRATADAICAEQHGPEYRMGEHHDGDGGWNWWAEADLAVITPEAGRFWAAIDDQPGNCWDWMP